MTYAAEVVNVSGSCFVVVPSGDGFIYVNLKHLLCVI